MSKDNEERARVLLAPFDDLALVYDGPLDEAEAGIAAALDAAEARGAVRMRERAALACEPFDNLCAMTVRALAAEEG